MKGGGGGRAGAFILPLHRLTVMLFNTLICPQVQRSVHIMVKWWTQAKSNVCVDINAPILHTHSHAVLHLHAEFTEFVHSSFMISASIHARKDATSIPREAEVQHSQLEMIIAASVRG